MSFWDDKEARRLFKELPFYRTPTETPCIKQLNNIDMLRELPIYNELNIVKTSKVLKGYARNYSIEIIHSKVQSLQLTTSKVPSLQLATSKLIIEDLYKDLFDEIKGFECQITLKALLSKYNENRDI